MMGGLQTLVLMVGGSKCPPPIFICENHRKSNKIMHCVEKKNIRLAVLKMFFVVRRISCKVDLFEIISKLAKAFARTTRLEGGGGVRPQWPGH